jgi:glycerol-3-phosphate O-acyltransferase
VTSPARSSSPADGLDPDHLLDEPLIAEALQRYSAEKSVPIEQVRKEARGYFAEMLASHTDRATSTWNRFGSWMLRAHDVVVDEEVLVRLRELDRKHSLALVFSHRSYLDGWVLPLALAARRFSPTFTFGGANLDMPFLGRLASNTGIIFIRRATKDVPVYRLALRGYIAYLVRHKANLAWSIEGGRTRTGKLRPPVHGILRYLADATEAAGPSAPDAMVVPIAIVYDQLHEVGRMTAEAKGGRKRPEDFRWLVSFARSQQRRLGRAYLSVGEPIPLRGRMTELRAEGNDTNRAVERVALDVSHRINRATPVTVTAIVCLALLGADRALCFDRRALQELVASGVLSCYEAGTEPVWRIAPDQHLIAAFYRNTVIHILVERAIGEVALLAAGTAIPGPDGQPVDAVETAWERALELRDLLKFEFFFPSREEFRSELRAELALLAPDLDRPLTPESAAELLIHARPHLAHLVLRPFLDAYLLVADRLVAAGDADVLGADQDAVLTEALHVGEQWELERRIASAESVSLELFRTGLKLAGHRGLLTSDGAPDLARRRGAFRDELAANVARLDEIAELARRASEERHGAQ